jgi:predicted aspartyl protease
VIQGSVSADGVPTVNLLVAGQSWSAIIDTGFNGDLELPDALRPFVNARFIGRVLSLLAGGQTLPEDCYLVDFPFDGQTLLAEATFVPSTEILLGTHLLRNHKVEINFPAATVRVEIP